MTNILIKIAERQQKHRGGHMKVEAGVRATHTEAKGFLTLPELEEVRKDYVPWRWCASANLWILEFCPPEL